MKLQFSDWDMDTEARSLNVAGQPVAIEPRVFDLLALLAANPDKIFSRDELLEQVWHGRVVSDTAISSAIKSARKAIGDSGQQQNYIQTVHGRGFRFIGEAMVPQREAPAQKTQNLEPILLVLPFKLISGNIATAKLRKMALQIEQILLRVPLLKVSAEASRYENESRSPRKIYEEVGATHLLEAVAEESDGTVYLDVSLTDAFGGFRLWSEQFEQSLSKPESAFEVLVVNVVRKCEPQLHRSIYDAAVKFEGELGAHALYLQASSLLALKGWHANSFIEAADLLRRCIALKPDFSQATAYLALILAFGHRVGLLRENEQIITETEAMVSKALALENQDSTVLGFVGCALCDIGQSERGEPLLRKAISVNKANAQAWVALGASKLMNKSIEEATKYLQHGVEISPLDGRLSVWRSLLALAQLVSGNIDAALEQAELGCQDDDNTYMPRVVLATIRLKQQNLNAARQAIKDAYRIKADLSEAEISALVGSKATSSLLDLV